MIVHSLRDAYKINHSLTTRPRVFGKIFSLDQISLGQALQNLYLLIINTGIL